MNGRSTTEVVEDLLERVGWTFSQNVFVVLVATGSAGLYSGTHWKVALLTGGWAALFALITTVLAQLSSWQPTGRLALVDRFGRTFLQSFLAVMATSTFTSFSDAGATNALAVAASAGFLAAVKSLIGLANPATPYDSAMLAAPMSDELTLEDWPDHPQPHP